jgi:hypothetical protein
MSTFIHAANSLTDYVDTCDTDGTLSEKQLQDIETYLAAWLYAERDQQYLSKKTGDASATYQGKTGMYLDCNKYGQIAMVLDVTGCLSELNATAKKGRHTASVTWLGKEVEDQDNLI